MAWYNDDNPETLNFMLAGNYHSGYGLLQSSLSAHPTMVCHGEVFHGSEKIRKSEHEQYFGPSGGRFADHFVPTHLSAEQYLNNKIFDNTLHGERAVGVKVAYDTLLHYDLWDYLDQKSRAGDFCLVHVSRNPVACYVSQQQAAARANAIAPGACYIDPVALTEFCRRHESAALKLDRFCPDRVVIPYHELLLDFRGVLERLFAFLELEFSPACIPNRCRVQRREVRQRVSNWFELCARVPGDVREFLNDPLLY
jgi:hypothetical protein